MIGDEDALKKSWGFKGSSGNRLCFVCKNCVRKASDLAGGSDEYLRAHDYPSLSGFDQETDDGLFYSADVLREAARQTSTKKAFAKLQMAFGLNHTPEGPLLDSDLRQHISPVSGNRYDAMHCWYSNGVFQAELHSFMRAACDEHHLVLWSDLRPGRGFIQQPFSLF